MPISTSTSPSLSTHRAPSSLDTPAPHRKPSSQASPSSTQRLLSAMATETEPAATSSTSQGSSANGTSTTLALASEVPPTAPASTAAKSPPPLPLSSTNPVKANGSRTTLFSPNGGHAKPDPLPNSITTDQARPPNDASPALGAADSNHNDTLEPSSNKDTGALLAILPSESNDNDSHEPSPPPPPPLEAGTDKAPVPPIAEPAVASYKTVHDATEAIDLGNDAFPDDQFHTIPPNDHPVVDHDDILPSNSQAVPAKPPSTSSLSSLSSSDPEIDTDNFLSKNIEGSSPSKDLDPHSADLISDLSDPIDSEAETERLGAAELGLLDHVEIRRRRLSSNAAEDGSTAHDAYLSNGAANGQETQGMSGVALVEDAEDAPVLPSPSKKRWHSPPNSSNNGDKPTKKIKLDETADSEKQQGGESWKSIGPTQGDILIPDFDDASSSATASTTAVKNDNTEETTSPVCKNSAKTNSSSASSSGSNSTITTATSNDDDDSLSAAALTTVTNSSNNTTDTAGSDAITYLNTTNKSATTPEKACNGVIIELQDSNESLSAISSGDSESLSTKPAHEDPSKEQNGHSNRPATDTKDSSALGSIAAELQANNNTNDNPSDDVDMEMDKQNRKKQSDEEMMAAQQAIRKEAISFLTDIEIGFARLRDEMHTNQMARYMAEIEMCAEGTHPELEDVYNEIQRVRDERIRNAEQRRKYQRICIDIQTRAGREQHHQQFLKDQAEIRSRLLLNTTEEWYRVNRERRLMDAMVPEYGFRPSQVPEVQERQMQAYLGEVKVLSEISRTHGFPAAPEMRPSTEQEIEDDLQQMARFANPGGAGLAPPLGQQQQQQQQANGIYPRHLHHHALQAPPPPPPPHHHFHHGHNY